MRLATTVVGVMASLFVIASPFCHCEPLTFVILSRR
jgi:hypothetical protein